MNCCLLWIFALLLLQWASTCSKFHFSIFHFELLHRFWKSASVSIYSLFDFCLTKVLWISRPHFSIHAFILHFSFVCLTIAQPNKLSCMLICLTADWDVFCQVVVYSSHKSIYTHIRRNARTNIKAKTKHKTWTTSDILESRKSWIQWAISSFQLRCAIFEVFCVQKESMDLIIWMWLLN